jgi:hypothetical protein
MAAIGMLSLSWTGTAEAVPQFSQSFQALTPDGIFCQRIREF